MEANSISIDSSDGGVAIVRLEGEHDIYTAPELRDRIYGVIGDNAPVVVDLTATAFVDSSVLGVLLGARRRAHEAGLGFTVLAGGDVDPGVRRVLEVTGLIPVLPVLDDRAAAIDHAKAGPTE